MQKQDGAPVSSGKRVVLFAALLSLLVLVLGLCTAPYYGVTSDEPVIYFGGDWNLWAMETDEPSRWRLKDHPPDELWKHTGWGFHPDAVGHWAFPGFPGFFCANVAKVARYLPNYEQVDAYHAGIILLHAIAVFALVIYLSRLLGTRRALFVAALYALYPCTVGHSHYNVKDWPMVGFYALTLCSFACAVVEDRARFYLQAGFWLGLGLCSKANLAFVGPTLLLWIPVAWWLFYRKQRKPSRASIAALIAIPFLAVVVFWAVWPYAHRGSLREQGQKLLDVASYILERGHTNRASFSAYSFFHLLVLTPPIDLLGLALAAVLPFRLEKRDQAVAALGWIWLLVPLVRIALPYSNFYDANRHFLEYVPALALLAGMGLDAGLVRAAKWIQARRAGWATRATAGGMAAALGLAAWPVLQYHPFETTYYNAFIGGLGGAQKLRMSRRFCQGMEFWCQDSEGDYWGFSYRSAVRDVNALAESGSRLWSCGNLIGPLTRWENVRPDLHLVGRNDADWLIVIPRHPFCSDDDQRFVQEHATVVREERRDGGLIYGIYKRNR